MTPHVAARLTIHEPDAVQSTVAARYPPALRSLGTSFGERRFGLIPDGRRRGSVLRREAVQRRLLAVADLIAAAAALTLVVSLPGSDDKPGVLVLAGMPLVVMVFKLAGLYDRDQLRLVHSTLDEAPLLLQLTGLYVLVVAIAQSVLVQGNLGGDQIAALWAVSFVAVVGGRMFARWLAGRLTSTERCLVIGERERAERIREKLGSSGARATVVATFPLERNADADPLDPESIAFIVNELQVHRIIIAPTTTDSAGIVELIRWRRRRASRSACSRACSRSSARPSSSTTSTG